MQTNSEKPELKNGDENILMIDRFQMGRLKLKEYSIRDQFSEERHPLGHTTVYFWQHRAKDSCTVKISATVTDSYESAHIAADHFLSNLANPSVFFETSEGHLRSEWLKKVEAVKVHMDSTGTQLIAATFILGNIFFHIHSSGEQEHSIKSFIDSYGEYWSFIDTLKNQRTEKKPDKNILPNFEVKASKTELKIGEVATLAKKGLDNESHYSLFLYVAYPKRLVDLYKEDGVFKIKIKPSASKALISPSVILLGVRPDGQFVRSKRLKFIIVPN